MSFTIRQFTIMLMQVGIILNMESGGGSSKRTKGSSTEMTTALAARLFGRKK